MDMPEQDLLQANLRRSIADVPDPCGAHDSYASHQIDTFEKSIEPLGVEPEFIRQSRRYRAGDYAQGIRRALERRDRIREILDRPRPVSSRESSSRSSTMLRMRWVCWHMVSSDRPQTG